MRKRGVLIFVVFVVLFISMFSSFALARLNWFGGGGTSGGDSGGDLGGETFNLTSTSFGKGQKLQGSLTFFLNDEFSDFITAKIKNHIIYTKQMKLLDYLDSAGANYQCKVPGCKQTYQISEPETEKGLDFSLLQEQLLGLKVTGQSIKISDLSFEIKGSSSEITCETPPVKIDIGDNGEINWQYSAAGGTCGALTSSDCYNENSEEINELMISQAYYCQEIYVVPTSKVRLGAEIKKKNEAGEFDLQIEIYDKDTGAEASCYLPVASSSFYEKVSCETNFTLVEAKRLRVCIRKTDSAPSERDYFIKSEETGEVCGFYYATKDYDGEYGADYALYVQESGFKGFTGTETFNKNSFFDLEGGKELKDYIQEYLEKSQGASDCKSDPCEIPIRIISNQDLTISNVEFKYSSGTSGIKYDTKIYGATAKLPEITMEKQTLPLSSLNITAPEIEATFRIEVFVNDKTLGSAEFITKKVPKILSISPLNPAATLITEFEAVTSSEKEIMKYYWNFGDGYSTTSTENTMVHTYNNIGNYTLTIQIEDIDGNVGSNSFAINVQSAQKAAIELLTRKKIALDGFKLEYELSNYKEDIDEILDLTELENQLLDISSEYDYASSDEEYTQIKQSLDPLKIPKKIQEGFILSKSKVFSNVNEIDLNYLEQLGAGQADYEIEEQYQNAISLWEDENLQIDIESKTISIVYDDDSTEDLFTDIILTVFESEKDSVDEVYLVIKDSFDFKSINFKTQKGVDLREAIGFDFYDFPKTLEFIVPGKADPSEMIIYVSPQFSELDLTSVVQPEPNKNYIAVLILLFIILIVIVTGVVLFVWSKYYQNFEKKGFKKKSDVYNLKMFIKKSLKAGRSKEEITQKLLNAGWNKKQIDYIFRKIKMTERAKQGKKSIFDIFGKRKKGKGKRGQGKKQSRGIFSKKITFGKSKPKPKKISQRYILPGKPKTRGFPIKRKFRK